MDHDSHGGMPSGMDMNMNATHSPTTMNMNNHGQHNMDGMGHTNENMMMVSIRLLMLFLVQPKRPVGFDSETQIF